MAGETFLDKVRDGAPALFRMRWWAIALRGLFAVIFGILCFATPAAALLSLVLVFGIFALADGIAGVVAAWAVAIGFLFLLVGFKLRSARAKLEALIDAVDRLAGSAPVDRLP